MIRLRSSTRSVGGKTRVTGDWRADREADDATLLGRVRAGDAGSYEVLYQRHEQIARRLARILVPPADVDDAVAESFARVLDVTLRGGGPTGAFRPYLLTALRRVCHDRLHARSAQVPMDSGQLPDPGQPFTDPAVASLDRSLIARAFRALPERWIAVLWHTEIEEESPAEVGRILGLSPNGVAALKYRALEGLRQAYLRMHIAEVTRSECRHVADRLAAFVRDAASRRDRTIVTKHLSRCDYCRDLCAELADLNGALRGLIVPIVLGGAAVPYLSAAHTAAAGQTGSGAVAGARAAGAARTGWPRRVGRLRLASRSSRWIAAAPTIAALALVLTLAGSDPLLAPPGHYPLPQAAAPGAPAQAAQPPHHQPSASAAPSATQPASLSASAPTSPAGTPAPGRGPSPAPAAALRLSATVAVSNTLLILHQVVFAVADTGTAATGEIAVSLTLPPVTLLPGIKIALWPAEGSGWTCQLTNAGADCQHGPIPAGAQEQGVILISVVGLATCGQPVQLTAVSGKAEVSAQSAEPVRC